MSEPRRYAVAVALAGFVLSLLVAGSAAVQMRDGKGCSLHDASFDGVATRHVSWFPPAVTCDYLDEEGSHRTRQTRWRLYLPIVALVGVVMVCRGALGQAPFWAMRNPNDRAPFS